VAGKFDGPGCPVDTKGETGPQSDRIDVNDLAGMRRIGKVNDRSEILVKYGQEWTGRYGVLLLQMLWGHAPQGSWRSIPAFLSDMRFVRATVLLPAAWPLAAREPVFRAETNLALVRFHVVRKKFCSDDLKPDDVIPTEDGKPRRIAAHQAA